MTEARGKRRRKEEGAEGLEGDFGGRGEVGRSDVGEVRTWAV